MSGVATLVEETGPKKGPRGKPRTWSSGNFDAGDAQRLQQADDVEAAAGPGQGGAGKGGAQRERGRMEKPTLMARQQQRMAKTMSSMRDVLNRMLCMGSALDEVDMSISPYVRFIWILSLGVMDISLVLVLIFWPQRDFMCAYNPASATTALENNILSTIGVIIGLHAGDVVPPHCRAGGAGLWKHFSQGAGLWKQPSTCLACFHAPPRGAFGRRVGQG